MYIFIKLYGERWREGGGTYIAQETYLSIEYRYMNSLQDALCSHNRCGNTKTLKVNNDKKEELDTHLSEKASSGSGPRIKAQIASQSASLSVLEICQVAPT